MYFVRSIYYAQKLEHHFGRKTDEFKCNFSENYYKAMFLEIF